MKNYKTLILCLAIILSFSACNNKDNAVTEITTEEESTSSTIDYENISGYESSNEAIITYWNGYVNTNKSVIKSTMVNDDIAQNVLNINDLAEYYYNLAVNDEDTTIHLDKIEISTRPYNIDNIDTSFAEIYGIEESEKSKVTVPTTKNGQDTYNIYEFITVKIKDKWFIYAAKETDSYSNSLDESDNTLTINSDVTYLNDDFNKINWTYNESINRYDGIKVSIAKQVNPNSDLDILFIAITNTYEETITFSGTLTALDKSNNEVGLTYININSLCSGDTYVTELDCTGICADKYEWDNININLSESNNMSWKVDSKVSTNNDDLKIDYTINLDEPNSNLYDIRFLVLDKDSNIICTMCDYPTISDTTYISHVDGYYGIIPFEEIKDNIKDVAVFTNIYSY